MNIVDVIHYIHAKVLELFEGYIDNSFYYPQYVLSKERKRAKACCVAILVATYIAILVRLYL